MEAVCCCVHRDLTICLGQADIWNMPFGGGGEGGDKVCMLTCTHPHKPLRTIKVTVCNHQADSPLYGVAACAIW